MAVEDRTLTCRACGAAFTFSAGEQAFFQERGMVNDPVRCPPCRTARRRAMAEPHPVERPLHQAVCTDCGGVAEVPFEPRPGVPVYCTDCYATRRGR